MEYLIKVVSTSGTSHTVRLKSPGPVFNKLLRVTLQNAVKSGLKYEKILNLKLRLKVSSEASQSDFKRSVRVIVKCQSYS